MAISRDCFLRAKSSKNPENSSFLGLYFVVAFTFEFFFSIVIKMSGMSLIFIWKFIIFGIIFGSGFYLWIFLFDCNNNEWNEFDFHHSVTKFFERSFCEKGVSLNLIVMFLKFSKNNFAQPRMCINSLNKKIFSNFKRLSRWWFRLKSFRIKFDHGVTSIRVILLGCDFWQNWVAPILL